MGQSALSAGVSALSPVTISKTGELPSIQSVPDLFDEMDFQQAVQCYLWALAIVSFAKEKETQEKEFGATPSDIVLYNTYEDKLGILTANATTPYILSFFNLAKTGPMVIDMPAGAIAGGLTDAWQREMVAIGEAGPDKGKGGKFLFFPPGSEDQDVNGYFNVHSSTMNLWFGIRALDPDPKKDEELIQAVKIYPYSQRDNPPKTNVLRPGGKKYNMGQPAGMDYWRTLHAILQDEPIEERDRFFIAWLDNLGIKKSQPFNPTERQTVILTAAAARGQLMAVANSFKKRFDNARHWPDREWDYPMIMSDPSQRVQNFDEFFQRASYFYEAVGYSKSMITKTPGIGQAYLGTYADQKGEWLDGGNNYTLHIPPDPPAANFWSITVYDAGTRCLIDNPQRNADLSSRKDLLKNPDGSVDLYFGPDAPAGKEKNWIQTVHGKHWFAYMRFYAPTEKYFDKSWKMGDIVASAVSLSDQDIADAFIYLLGRELVLKQQRLDFEEGFKWNQVIYREPGGVAWANPNLDVAYNEAWVAVDEKTCVVLEVPEIKGRYYTWQMLNGWGETLVNINERTYPGHPFGKFALCLKGSDPAIPEGCVRVDLPSKTSHVLARVELGNDIKEAIRLQKLFTLTPQGEPKIEQPIQVPLFEGTKFPGAEMFQNATEKMQHEPDINEGMEAVQAKVKATEALVNSGVEGTARVDQVIRDKGIPILFQTIHNLGVSGNGWTRPKSVGNYKDDYVVRTAVNYGGIWANNMGEVTYFTRTGNDGSTTSTLTFPKEALPSAKAAYFWSIIAVDVIKFQVLPNPLKRYLLNNQSGLKNNPDGSLTLVFGPKPLAEYPESNWLPTIEGQKYNLTFRLYRPAKDVTDGTYFPPDLVPAN